MFEQEIMSIAGTTFKTRVLSVKSVSDKGYTVEDCDDDKFQDRIEVITLPDQKRHLFRSKRSFARFIGDLIRENRAKLKSAIR